MSRLERVEGRVNHVQPKVEEQTFQRRGGSNEMGRATSPDIYKLLIQANYSEFEIGTNRPPLPAKRSKPEASEDPLA